MQKNKAKSVDEYLDNLSEEALEKLGQLRIDIAQIAPELVECIRFHIPNFLYKNTPLLSFAAYKKHYSIFVLVGDGDVFCHHLARKIIPRTNHFAYHEYPSLEALETIIDQAKKRINALA
jgi:hypothetical protein